MAARLGRETSPGMAATVAAAADQMPEEGSLYFDYLCAFPVGVSMQMELQPDAEALDEHETAMKIFTIRKVGADAWEGVPGCESESGVSSTQILFEHVCEMMKGEDGIKVAHGRDPRKVKREMIEDGVEDTICFFSISEVIELDSDADDSAAASDGAPPRAPSDQGQSDTTRCGCHLLRRRCLRQPRRPPQQWRRQWRRQWRQLRTPRQMRRPRLPRRAPQRPCQRQAATL